MKMGIDILFGSNTHINFFLKKTGQNPDRSWVCFAGGLSFREMAAGSVGWVNGWSTTLPEGPV